MTLQDVHPSANTSVYEPSEDEIRLLSYLIWEREGKPYGREAEHWLRAKRELVERNTARTTVVPPKVEVQPKPTVKTAKSAKSAKKSAAAAKRTAAEKRAKGKTTAKSRRALPAEDPAPR
jgi:hypothetical protein